MKEKDSQWLSQNNKNQLDIDSPNRKLDRKVHQLETMIEFGRVLAGVTEPKDVAQRLGLTLAGQFLLQSWAVIAFREGRPPLIVASGMFSLTNLEKEGIEEIHEEMLGWTKPLVVQRNTLGQSTEVSLGGLANKFRIFAIVPLISGETVFGFIALGKRAGRKPLDQDDLDYAFGLGRQAVVAFEASWQAEEFDRWRIQMEARNVWRGLDRLSRLVFVAASRLGYGQFAHNEEIVSTIEKSLRESCFQLSPETLFCSISRLVEQGLLARDHEGRLRVEYIDLMRLPETRKPLPELVRESMERIGAYLIEEKLGSGGMGEVFRAVNVHDGSAAAVKLLFPHLNDNKELRRRFEREGAIVAAFSHPSIVRLFERGEHQGRLYLAMELLAGEVLNSYILNVGFTPTQALDGFIDIATALAALHERGIVHRDIKSKNIMRLPSGRLVLLDFGLANTMASSALTQSNQILGTVPYMAPEQLKGESMDFSADIWSAGLVFYEMLVGKLPWRSQGYVLVSEILNFDPNFLDPKKLIHDEWIRRLIEEMLVVSPKERLPNGGELLRRLRQAPSLPFSNGGGQEPGLSDLELIEMDTLNCIAQQKD